jgi:pilus assembly protein CpaB
MNGKPFAMLMLAVVCGLGAMYGTTKLLSKGQNQQIVEMHDVLVATRDLKIEEVLNKPDLVKVVRMEKNAVPAGSFSQAKDIEDRWVQIGMLEGEPVVDRKLAPRGMPAGLVARIPKGMRAYAIEVNEQTGVSGFVLPDHRVDVIQIEPNAQGRAEADTVLQDVLVLAAGQTFSRADDRTVQARTVTLAVTEDQAEILVAAKQRGTLTLSLRSLNDHEQTTIKKKKAPLPDPKQTEVAVKPPEPLPPPPPVAAPTPPAPTPTPARYVVIYRGHDKVDKLRIDQPNEAAPDALVSAPPPQN